MCRPFNGGNDGWRIDMHHAEDIRNKLLSKTHPDHPLIEVFMNEILEIITNNFCECSFVKIRINTIGIRKTSSKNDYGIRMNF